MVCTHTPVRMPAWFLTHGGGPMPILGDQQHKEMVEHWKTLSSTLKDRPKAILLISGHHEERIPTVTSSPHPPMIYDYRGFPPEAYKVQYPAPGDSDLAHDLIDLLRKAGWEVKEDKQRGYDHGVYVPLSFIFPQANIPVVQLSLMSNLNAQKHIELGEVLAPLRDQGVLVIGSGASWHNNREVDWHGSKASLKSKELDDWLQRTLAGNSLNAVERKAAFADWLKAPQARYSHPREEHLLPAHVVLGAARNERANVIFEGHLFGAAISSYQWD